jgi:hypothetical protein
VSFPRCRHCRSPINPQRYRRCIACGADVDNPLPPRKKPHAQALEEGSKDGGSAFAIFNFLGVLGIVGFFATFFANRPNGYLMILTGVMAAAGNVVWMHRVARGGKDQPGPGCFRAIVVVFLCGAALLFGLGILLGFACVQGGGFD